MTETQIPAPLVRRLRAAAVAGLLALITLCLAWELWLAPTGSGTLALKVVPLVPCLAGLLRHRMVTFRWLALLLWLYVLEGLVRATTERGLGQALAVAELLLCLLLFVVCTVYIRRRLRSAPRMGTGDGETSAGHPPSAPVPAPAGDTAAEAAGRGTL